METEGLKTALPKYSEKFFSSSFSSVDNMWHDIEGVINHVITDQVPTKQSAARLKETH